MLTNISGLITEMKEKYDSFLDRINTENIYNDPEDQADEESE
jgi:hypothetical protein